MGNRATAPGKAKTAVVEYLSPPLAPRANLRPLQSLLSLEAGSCSALHRDRDAQSFLITFLSLSDLAVMSSTCRLWFEWIVRPSGHASRAEHRRLFGASQLPRLSVCSWLNSRISTLEQRPDMARRRQQQDDPQAEIERQLPVDCPSVEHLDTELMFACLPRFTRLKKLQLDCNFELMAGPRVQSALTAAFTQLGGHLECLSLQPYGNKQVELIALFFAQVHRLTRMHTLVVEELMDSEGKMDLAPLHRLPNLRCLRFKLWGDRWLLSSKQFSALALCAQLRSLDVGPLVPWVQWSELESDRDTFRELGVPLSLLVNLHAQDWRVGDDSLLKQRPWQASRSAVGPLASPLVTAGLLTDLNLESSMLSPNVWPPLLQLRSLTALRPLGWQGMNAKAFEQLSRFPALRRICVAPSELQQRGAKDRFLNADLTADQFAHALTLCPVLDTVELKHLDLSATQLEQICVGCKSLRQLELSSVVFAGSLECLSLAPRLSHLILRRLMNPQKEPIEARLCLPSMRALDQLTIVDLQSSRLTSERAAVLNAQMLLRMPALNVDRITQNLLLPAESELPAEPEV